MDYEDLQAASTPDELRASLAAKGDELHMAAHTHHGEDMTSVRSITYQGHEIRITTTYAITIDGQPFEAGLIVDNAGNVHYHGLPTREFPSAIDLVKKVIDQFPDDFTRPAEPTEPGHHHREER